MTYKERMELLTMASRCLSSGTKRLLECEESDRPRLEEAVRLDFANLVATYSEYAPWVQKCGG